VTYPGERKQKRTCGLSLNAFLPSRRQDVRDPGPADRRRAGPRRRGRQGWRRPRRQGRPGRLRPRQVAPHVRICKSTQQVTSLYAQNSNLKYHLTIWFSPAIFGKINSVYILKLSQKFDFQPSTIKLDDMIIHWIILPFEWFQRCPFAQIKSIQVQTKELISNLF